MKESLGEDAELVDKTSQEGLDWLEKDEERTKEDYDNKQKEIEGVLGPIIQKAYQANMPAGGMPATDMPTGGMPAGDDGPAVEEID